MALKFVTDPKTGERVEVVIPYQEWVWYADWVKYLVEKGLPVPKPHEPMEVPEGLPSYGDPVAYQRRLRDSDD